ncbi:hypothetical protein PTTG_30524, partial [Puccinia triticina 1-1 BBBD Race 1]
MATISTKDELNNLPMLLGTSNYPLWIKRMEGYLAHKKLDSVLANDPGLDPAAGVREQLRESAYIIGTKLSDRIYNGTVRGTANTNGYELWTKIKRMYGRGTTHNNQRAIARWNQLCYNGDLTIFIEQVESCLAQFDAISFDLPEKTICGTIIAKIAKKRKGITDPLISNVELMENLDLLLETLRDIANYDDATHHKPNYAEKQATALSSNGRTRPPPKCKNGVDNPEASYSEENCWALHPEKRP